ncbi:MAG: MBOAT family protein [Desulforhopalus sp.]|nr:MBOAT family protein [Desulforhopalus sp.]
MITSYIFWLFVLIGPFVFWFLPAALKFPLLALFSVGVIAFFDLTSAALLVGAIIFIDLALRLDRHNAPMGKRALLALSGLIACHLIIWKLVAVREGVSAGNIDHNIILPLGISYFSFKLLHFIIDAYIRRISGYRLDLFSVYIFLPTTFSAGPIQRYDRFLSDMLPRFDWSHVLHGATRVCYGIIKQFVLVSIILGGLQPDLSGKALLTEINTLSTGGLWLFLFIFYLKLYLNFSAYTDIAIGTSRLFGFVIMENFHFPLLATSIDEFWRRWHMTLSDWCREYIYQPILGLFRRPVLAAYATFAVIGLWHALTLNRLIWGLMHGTVLVVYFYLKRKNRRNRRTPRQVGSEQNSWLHPLTSLKSVWNWGLTQSFVVLSMTALVVEGNDPVAIGKILLRLFSITS